MKYLSPSWLIDEKLRKDIIKASKYARGNLLDVGCGNRPYYDILAPKVTSYIGLDIPLKYKRVEKKRKIDKIGSALNIPYPDNHFYTAVSFQVLEHIPKPKRFFDEAYRVLKYNGHLILTTNLNWFIHEEPYDFYRFTKYGLSFLARNSGFKIVYIKPQYGFWAMIGQRLSMYLSSLAPNKIIKACLLPLCSIIQFLFLILDKLHCDEKETLNYIMVAKKI